MIQIIGHIECERRLNAAIAKGRGSADVVANREGAISEIKALGFTEGDAIRWIDGKKRG